MTAETSSVRSDANTYLHRIMLALIVIAMVGFALFSLSGATDIRQMPLITHMHALSMSAWLILAAMQSHLGSSGRVSLHKTLGRLGIVLAVIIVITGGFTAVHTISAGRLPPFFTAGYFLVLGFANLTLFALFVGAALIFRKNTSWHRRLMLGAMIALFEPVLGRLLPLIAIPVLGGPEAAFPVLLENREMLEWLRLILHLAIVAGIMLGDRLITGRFHPAFVYMLVAVASLYAAANGISALGPVSEFANGLVPTP